MNNLTKCAAIVAVAGTFTAATVTAGMARDWRPWAAAGAGFAAGAVVGSAAANVRAGYYGPGHYGHGYAYGPSYGYASAPRYYVEEPGYQAYAAAPGAGGCWVATDSHRGYGYYGACPPRKSLEASTRERHQN